ncbi:hypothetical protein LCGC14_0208880 [marine sediment metagenome]|uniref:Uncharacterized protein n=1 Tax=marine sediment metagenome TaxID=412755 RepID=A0A0F9UY19_9ZZZZ
MTDTTALQNVIQVDDKNGNHFWICDVYHTTGTATDVLVPNSVLAASQIADSGARSGDIQVTTDDSATDSVREVTIASGVATGLIKLVIRFSGSAAGIGSGHGVL